MAYVDFQIKIFLKLFLIQHYFSPGIARTIPSPCPNDWPDSSLCNKDPHLQMENLYPNFESIMADLVSCQFSSKGRESAFTRISSSSPVWEKTLETNRIWRLYCQVWCSKLPRLCQRFIFKGWASHLSTLQSASYAYNFIPKWNLYWQFF